MKANETRLQPVLEGEKQYVIPLFQRHYSWKKNQWKTLWDDFIELYEADDERDHFLGAIVTMPIDMRPHGISKYLLIDGQQRIITLFVMLAAMRDLAEEQGNIQLAQKINEQHLVNKWGEGSNVFKMLPTETDRDIFYKVINGGANGQTRLAQAYHFFIKQLKGRGENGKPYDLRRLHNILLQQFTVVSIVLAKDENPYLIFESLNAKGQPLTHADLVRNHLFMRINDPEEQQLAYKDLWHPIEVELGDKLTNFLWRYLTKDGTFVRKGSIYEAIKARLSKLPTSGQVIDILMDMRIYADYYKRLIDPSHEPNIGIRRRLSRINRWEIKTAYPFLLALYDDYERGDLTANDMCDVLDIIESYVIRRFFCRIPTNALNRTFISLYKSLNHDDLVDSLRSQLMARNWPTDEDFITGWIKFPVYSSGTAKCRHILESLEENQTHNNEPVDIAHPRITIEHVMPQKLNEAWELQLGSNAAQIHEGYLHTIGNLTLTGENESMGNSAFATKKLTFSQSNFTLNKYFTDQDDWNGQAIEKRAYLLNKVASEIWQRPITTETTTQENDPTGHKPTRFILFGKNYPVQTWREVLSATVSILAQHHGIEYFMTMTSRVTGNKRQYIAYTNNDMVSPVKVPNTSLWIETNLSSRSILSITIQTITACGHNESEFQVYWQ